MRMRTLFVGALALACLTIGSVGLPGDDARAEPDAKGAAVEVFDVRIVRVVTAVPETIENPCPILSGTDTTTELGWAEVLAALKKRGATQVLMDQRVTGAQGQLVRANQERQVPVIAPQSRVKKTSGEASENLAAARMRMGCKADLIAATGQAHGGRIEYKLEVRGVLPKTSQAAEGPTETLTTWEGSHPPFAKRTLVLTNRQQARDPGASAAQGIELYCFVTRH